MVLNQIILLFSQDRQFLEHRGSLIVRQLCTLLEAEAIFRALSLILQKTEDCFFASLMVQTLNLILLTSSELFELRRSLKDAMLSPEGRELLCAVLVSWTHNPIATFSLCLLSQAYELAAALVFQFAEIEVTVGFLMQVDKLVQLLESPIFIHLRLQLLEPARHPFLLKSLYGLLMLLPAQGTAYTHLKMRLESVTGFGLLTCIPASEYARSVQVPVSETKELNFPQILQTFRNTQALHTAKRKEAVLQRSLLNSTADDEKADEGAAPAST